jgi:hypothetical protein
VAYILLNLNSQLKFSVRIRMHAFSRSDLQTGYVPVYKAVSKNRGLSRLYKHYKMLCLQMDVTHGAELFRAGGC